MNHHLSHEVLLVALHESINANVNVFNDIAERISEAQNKTWRGRVVRYIGAIKLRMKETLKGAKTKLFRKKREEETSQAEVAEDGEIVCIIAIDASLNPRENVFRDITESVYERHVQKRETVQQRQDHAMLLAPNQDDDEEKHRRDTMTTMIGKPETSIRLGMGGRFLRAAKRTLTCSSCLEKKR